MAQVIQIKRRLGSSGAPASGTGAGQVRAGEMATSINPDAAGGVANLYIGGTNAVHTLVSNTRQLETTGNQTGITGNKTFAATGQITIAPGDATGGLHLTGGTAGDILSTDSTGVLTWITPPAPVEVGPTAPATPANGDMWLNNTNNELRIWNGTAWVIANVTVNATAPTTPSTGKLWLHPTTHVLSVWSGTAWIATNFNRVHWDDPGPPAGTHVDGDIWFSPQGPRYYDTTATTATPPNWPQATLPGFVGVSTAAPVTGNGDTTPLGITSATDAQIAAGTNDVYPIDSRGLHDAVLGLTPVALSVPTATAAAARRVIPAINELVTDLGALDTRVTALSGAVRFVGNYDADANEVTSADTGTLTANAVLPAASAANRGWFVIVTDAGTVPAPPLAAATPVRVGDWIISTGPVAGPWQWIHVPLHHVAVTAANVGVTVTNLQAGWTNVQLALEGIYGLADAALTDVAVDDVSIWGDGTGTAPSTGPGVAGQLVVALVDGGTYP